VRSTGVYFPANGHFYTLGGRSSDAAGSDILNPYEFNPSTNTWTQKSATFSSTDVNNMVGGVLNINGGPRIVVVGGSTAGGTTATDRVAAYDPTTDTMTDLSSDPWPGVGALGDILPGGAAVVGNKLYVLGGFEINVGMVDDIWEFDADAAAGSRWTHKNAHLPTQLGYIPTAALGGMIYTAGGSSWDGTTLVDSADSYKYDPATDTITSYANIPAATAETKAVVVNGEMWVLGGGRTAPNPTNQVYIYNTSSGWRSGPPFVNARRNDAAGSDGTNIWMVGGYDTSGTNPLSSMEIYQASSGGCPTPPTDTPTATNTPGTPVPPTATNTPGQPTATNTATGIVPTATATSQPGSPTVTSTPCTINFSDVHPEDYFYEDVRCVYCLGAVSGYSDGTFRPFNNTTRGQMTKIIVIALQIPIVTPTGTPTFSDVEPGSPFYDWIETAAADGIVSGYADGTFRPNNYVTRGQLSKIDVIAASQVFHWEILNPVTPTFSDVPPGSAFYTYIETVACHGVVSGYADGTFRPNNNAIRAQIAKIVCLTSRNPADACNPTGTPEAVSYR
jgi:hypothetical protein